MTREGPLRVAVVGAGAVGRRAAAQLGSGSAGGLRGRPGPDPADVVLVHHDRRGGVADVGGEVDVVIITAPVDARPGVEAALERGAHVVVTGDHPAQIRRLLTLDSEARERGLSVAVGSAMAPGLSCVLARHAAAGLDRVSEIHVASAGTGGPACARRHHRALTSVAVDWELGWRRRPGGSGRELVWFPEPVGGADCYRASRPDPALLVPAFPGVRRVTARLEATRRDRMTSWLPMLRPPHPEGLVGAVRVEVRGWKGGVAETVVVGASAPPAPAAGAVAALVALRAGAGALARPGVAGLAELVADPAAFLADLARRGIRTTVFEGAMGPVRSALDAVPNP